MTRQATIARATSETDIRLTLDLDGRGSADVATGVGFFDHMLTALARHSLMDLTVAAKGDLHIDDHHTVEDVGIVLGQALRQALGDKRGIRRFDISGRPFLSWSVPFQRPKIGSFDTELVEEFFRAFAFNAGITLHVTLKAGSNAHHVAEACFKAAARALRMAVELDPRTAGVIPSTKGSLEG